MAAEHVGMVGVDVFMSCVHIHVAPGSHVVSESDLNIHITMTVITAHWDHNFLRWSLFTLRVPFAISRSCHHWSCSLPCQQGGISFKDFRACKQCCICSVAPWTHPCAACTVLVLLDGEGLVCSMSAVATWLGFWFFPKMRSPKTVPFLDPKKSRKLWAPTVGARKWLWKIVLVLGPEKGTYFLVWQWLFCTAMASRTRVISFNWEKVRLQTDRLCFAAQEPGYICSKKHWNKSVCTMWTGKAMKMQCKSGQPRVLEHTLCF